ncbi:HPr kinase/phosphorylase [Insolitispirillum peregrinum]|uniref:Hpr(Ser) kinase/phosphatase n=1 Tax=Insolitispirillum peregrinum TaxID=80876 RepID=A0A1N7PX54_9PROT|nr:HPr kinase/phosphatase C-terminal domain-containing protein [Insolitispirillum peregrinum]SIT15145.1 Hpr(Ser) kinase/phosphatase [Insolitispirillum peregrinum]
MPPLIHASCVALGDDGVLLRGPSGSGKSDLALRLIDQGAMLVGDDYCQYQARDGVLHASPQPTIPGLLEVRGLGIIRLPWRPEIPVRLIVDLTPDPQPERMPAPEQDQICGLSLPVVRLNPFQASAVAKVRLAVLLATGIIGRL